MLHSPRRCLFVSMQGDDIASLAAKRAVWLSLKGQKWGILFPGLGLNIVMCDPPALSSLVMGTVCSRMGSNKMEKGHLSLMDWDVDEK